MHGESNLDKLLKSLDPVLQDGEFVFCTVPRKIADTLSPAPLCRFAESEGESLILDRQSADRAGLSYDHIFRLITLTVHSSLDAVGLLAAVTAKLAEAGISVNVVSAYYHDHLFVPRNKASKAIKLLESLMT